MIKIEDNRKMHVCSFEDLEAGDLFEVADSSMVYMKIEHNCVDKLKINCISMYTGIAHFVGKYARVTPVKGTLTIEYT